MQHQDIYSVALKEIRNAFPDTKGVYVFGGFAKDTVTRESDLDLAILLDKPANTVKLWEVAQNIASKIHRDVDLIDLLAASTVFRFQIVSTGKRIDTLDFKSCDSFEDLSYSMYLRFNEERKEILEDIAKRGKIY